MNASASISSSTQSIHSLGSMPGDMSHDGRVGRWALGFDKLMEDPAGLGCFKVCQPRSSVAKGFVFPQVHCHVATSLLGLVTRRNFGLSICNYYYYSLINH